MIRSALFAAAALIAAAPAYAGQCPAGKTAENALSGAPTAPVKVTDTVLEMIDLGPEISVSNRQLRTRRLVIQPGGIVPLHSHKDRPALIYTLSGTIQEYRSTCSAPITHKTGDLVREAEGISHWWKNNGKTQVVLLSSDVHNGQ